jgi:tripartite-type tricarboxylate transporter receptor subunit TctC
VRDFAPVTLMSVNPLLMVVPASSPFTTAQEFIAWARDNKTKANYCSIGPGSPSHLAAELFKSMAGVDMTHIPYSGSGPALTATIGGVCSVLFDSVLSAGPHVKSGKLKVLATGNKQRLASWPQVPTLAESGLPGFEAFTWGALLAPAGTPPDVVSRLQAETARIMALPEVRQKIEDMGALPGGGSSADLDAFTRSEISKWAKVIKDGNIKPD